MKQNDIKIMLACEMQHMCTCYDQRPFCYVSLKVVIIVLKYLNETSHKV